MHRILEEITAETAEMIATQARAHGLSVDDYLRSLLPPAHGGSDETTQNRATTPAELARAYGEWAASHDPNTPVIVDDRREAIYEDERP